MNTTTFEIPSWNMDKLRKEIERVNKRTTKFGCAPLVAHIGEEHKRVHPHFQELVDSGVYRPESVPQFTTYDVEVTGEPPKMAGWTFLGKLDHKTLEGQTLVNTVPGQTVPKEFWDSKPRCDHCHKIRRRVDTFVLRHDDGRHVQIGRQCIKDFLGHDPQYLLRSLTSWFKLIAELEDPDSERYYDVRSNTDYQYDPDTVLRVTAAIIADSGGWVSVTRAREWVCMPTRDKVIDALNPPNTGSSDYQSWRKWIDQISIDDPKHVETAAQAREWLAGQDDSEYIHNLKVLAKAKEIPHRSLGYWCSLIGSYLRAEERLAEQKAESKGFADEYIGNLKQRMEFDVVVQSVHSFDSYYGTTTLHRMRDEAGHCLIWFCTNGTSLDVNTPLHIKGTVKAHEEYQGKGFDKPLRQTILNRVVVIDEKV